MEDLRVTILAFNMGYAGRVVNGPGISLYNFIKILKNKNPSIKIDLFTELKVHNSFKVCNCLNISSKREVLRSIQSCDILHHWSGITSKYSDFIRYANLNKKKVFVGPNVLDGVKKSEEKKYIEKIDVDLFFAINTRIIFKLCKIHNLKYKKFKTLIIGPSKDLWKNTEKDNFILWKGNSLQKVKDIDFAIKVSQALPQYEFRFIGYPNTYNYFDHIEEASRAKLYYCTSLSETKPSSLIEQWATGTPSVTHPKIELHGINYETGIITNKDVQSYASAIEKIMEDEELFNHLSNGALKYVKDNFSENKIYNDYIKYIKEVQIESRYHNTSI